MRCNTWISSTQSGHLVSKKLRIYTRPSNEEESTSFPSELFSLNSGTVSPTFTFAVDCELSSLSFSHAVSVKTPSKMSTSSA